MDEIKKVYIDLPSFPVNCLPDNLRDLVTAVAENVQVREDLVAVPLLSILAGCCKRAYQVRVDSGYTEPLSLYSITIARPSERKTAILSLLRQPIWDYMEQFNNFTHKTEIELGVRKPLTAYVDDTTPEKMAKLMSENGGTISLISDEPDALNAVTGTRYGKSGGNLGLVLQAWSAGNVLIQRVTEDRRISIERATLSISLMAQPHFVWNLVGNQDMSERGFIQRILFSYPTSLVGNRTFRKPEVPQTLLDEYKNLVFSLLDKNYNSSMVEDLRLSERAYKEAEGVFMSLEPRLVDELKEIEGWAGKAFGQMIRIAGIFHCAIWHNEAAEHEIEADTILGACAVMMYFIEHAKAVLNGDQDKEYQEVRYVWDKILNMDMKEFTYTDVKAVSKYRGEKLKKILSYLVEVDYLETRTEKSGSNWKIIYSFPHKD